MKVDVPEKVLHLATNVRDAGGRALLVGGCVRDALMQKQPKDWDVEVYGVEPARLRQLLDQVGDVNVVGEAFTVYKLGSDLDVGLPRRERKTGRGHRAFVIEYHGVRSFGASGRLTFEIKLSEGPDGAIDLLYGDNAPNPGDGRNAGIGIENATGTDAL